MIKNFLVKLVRNFGGRPNRSWQRERMESDLAEERHQQIIANREVEGRQKYTSEVIIPTEEEILDPSNSGAREEEK